MSGPNPVGYTAEMIVTIGPDDREMSRELVSAMVQGEVEESRLAPSECRLRFRDPHQTVLEQAGLGIGTHIGVAIASSMNSAPTPLVDAEVTALEVEHDGTGSYTVVQAADRLHRLLRGRRVAGYRQMTVSDVVEKVAKDCDIPVGEVDATSTVHAQICQANVSDWEFLNQLADDVGARLRMVDGQLHFRRAPNAAETSLETEAGTDPYNPLVLELGRNLLRCRAITSSAGQVTQLRVRGWDMSAKRAVAHAAAAESVTAATGVDPADLARIFEAPDLLVVQPPFHTQEHVDEAAVALAHRVAGRSADVEALVSGNPHLRAGSVVSLTGVAEPFAGSYTVTAVRHVVDPETGYTTWAAMSGEEDRSVSASAPGPPVDTVGLTGAVPALVSDNNDPEGLGRVRLILPWLSGDFVTDWARTLQLGAGDQRGTLFVPEVGDEVLAAFQAGDLRAPFVLGGLYNGLDRPRPGETGLIDQGTGAVNRRAIVSRTGHRIELLEAANGPRGVSVVTGDNALRLELDEQSTKVVVHSDGSVVVEAAQSVLIESGGSLDLRGREVTITAEDALNLDAGRTLAATGGTNLVVEAPAVSVDGSTATEITSGGTCTVRAALVRIN